MKNLVILLVFVFVSISNVAFAESTEKVNKAFSAFQNIKIVESLFIVVPTVIEVPFVGQQHTFNSFIVEENETQKILPWYFDETYTQQPVHFSLQSSGVSNVSNLTDGNMQSSAEYSLPEDRAGYARINITGVTPLSSSELSVSLAQNVALPTSVEIRVLNNDGSERIVLAEKRMTSSVVSFPKTTAREWIISFKYAQPLRIGEINLVQDDVEKNVVRGLRFLAQPNMSYSIYYNPDRYVTLNVVERGDLSTDKGVITLAPVSGAINKSYQPADVDGDGVKDIFDNCVQISNIDQVDVDGNGRGDVCDDFDRDGIVNNLDNCPNEPNARQEDEDGDGIGDVCDEEESRFTERHSWVPWVGMGIAVSVLVFLFALVAKGVKKEEETPEVPNDEIETETGGGGN